MQITRTHITLPAQMREALKALADKTGLTVSDHIRRAVELYLKGKK